MDVQQRTIYQNSWYNEAHAIDWFDFRFVCCFTVKAHTMYVSMDDVLIFSFLCNFCVAKLFAMSTRLKIVALYMYIHPYNVREYE